MSDIGKQRAKLVAKLDQISKGETRLAEKRAHLESKRAAFKAQLDALDAREKERIAAETAPAE
jgi:uncharacterized protein with NAD-binding domain and iron-sulfur cluster